MRIGSKIHGIGFLLTAMLASGQARAADPAAIPVRGLHVMAPKPAELADTLRFIREALPREGVNLLVMEFNYRYQYSRRPEVVDADALSRADIRSILEACRAAGVRLMPMINLLGHQSWAKTTFGLLRAHPEFDETPGRYPENQGIYCRSYCPLHPEVHAVVFDLIDELAEVCEADAFHVGMDEVFLLGEEDCPRCKGRDRAELLAQEIKLLRDHLAESKREMWMWSDRLLDGETTGLGKWEASANATAAALGRIPKDVVVCDWHYDSAPPTALHFAVEGFPVVSSPWRRAGTALAQLEWIRHGRKHAPAALGQRLRGMLQTTWCPVGAFVKAYFREGPADPKVLEAATCFRELFAELRRGQ